MRRDHIISYFAAGILAASTFAYGQDTSAPPPPPSDQQQSDSNGGWRKVGEPPPAPQQPDQNNYNQSAPAYSGNQQYQPPQQYQAPQQYPPPQQYQPPNGQQPYSQPAYNPPNNAPSQPVPAQLTIPAGTYLMVRVNQPLSSDKNQPGDPFTATLEAPVVVNGVVVAEPGETLGGRVAIAEKHGSGKPARLGVQLTTLTLADGQQVPIQSQLISRRGPTTPGGVEAGTIATTTAVGAAIGAAAGWGTGAAIGAATGGLAGLIGVVVTHNHPSVIYPEQQLTFRLEAPVTISTTNAPQAFHYIEPGEYNQQAYNLGPGPYAGYAGAAPAPPPPAYYGYPYSWGYPYYPYYWGPGVVAYWGPGFFWGRGYIGPYRGVFVRGPGFGYGHVGRR